MKKILLPLFLICFLIGCGDKKETEPVKTPAGPNITQTPDVGKIEQVSVTSKGMGITPGAAINDALKTAIAQVNGVRVESNSANLNTFKHVTANLDVEIADGKDSAKATATVQGQAFAEAIIAQSKGIVSSFKVITLTAPKEKDGSYTVEIEAKIAKFKAPEDSGKIKIVVAPLRSETATFDIGGRKVPAEEILSPIRQQIIDALTQTGRFTVLDRQFEGEMQNELNMISSGQTVNTDFAKMGQALSADLVWVGVVNNLGYNKHVRKLQTSDRDLVSYSGGWAVSQRMINLATRQILQSNTLHGAPPPIAPTTLGAKFNEHETLKNIGTDIVKKATEAIILQTFPISIVKREGNNVVLSQGGQAVKEKGRYMIYLLGEEIKDPQTGQSLGNVESPCCEVVINRVTPKVSYGTLENFQINISDVQPGALQLKEALSPAKEKVSDSEKKEEKSATQPTPTAQANQPAKTKPKRSPKSVSKENDDW